MVPAPLVVDVVVAARDAASTLAVVLARLSHRSIRQVVVVDRGSLDDTGAIARDAGALVLRDPGAGHGAACLLAVGHLAALPEPPDVVAFVPADGSADAAGVPALIAPIAAGSAELAIALNADERPLGDRVVIGLIRAVYRHRFHAVGPMRAIRLPALVALGMSDRGGGWDVEMQVRAVKLGLAIAEVPIPAQGAPARGGPVARAAASGRSLFHIVRHATMR